MASLARTFATTSSANRSTHLEDEALAETGNIILNSWVATIANLLKQRLTMSLPIVIRRDQHRIFESARPETTVILFLHIKFDIRSREIGGYVALMMDVPSSASSARSSPSS